ncbi:hypothetical protein JCM11491_006704 [Sporobolomyces phaffii]
MARAKSKKVQQSESESEEEYVVELLKAHRRKAKGLEYRVKWQGFDKPADDTWEPESGLTACTVAVEKYWKTKEPEEQLERYKVGSKAYKELKARLDAEADGDEDEDEGADADGDEQQEDEDLDDEDEDVVEASSRQKRSEAKAKAKAAQEREKDKSRSTSPGKKRSSSSRTRGDDEEQPRSSKRAKKEAEEESAAEEEKAHEGNEQGNGDEEGGYDDDDEGRVNWEDVVSTTDAGSWEDLVECVETCDKDLTQESAPVRVLCIWKKQNPDGGPYKSWVDASIARQTCPQAVIDFLLMKEARSLEAKTKKKNRKLKRDKKKKTKSTTK